MSEATRIAMWSVLVQAFEGLADVIRRSVPDAKSDQGYHYNEVFPFRAYAEYLAGTRVVIISFDVQLENGQVLVAGDVSEEGGFVLSELVRTSLDLPALYDGRVLRCASEFASSCRDAAPLLLKALEGTGDGGRKGDGG